MLRVDNLTNGLREVSTGILLDAEIHRVRKPDLVGVTKPNGWHFDWGKEMSVSGRLIYKLVIKGDSQIQGLISMEDRQSYFFLPLIETAPHNFGKEKLYANAPKCLTAFACKRSFESGYHGEVAFIPKTRLIKHYEKELGAIKLPGMNMIIESQNARNLVSLYFKDFIL